MKESGQFNRTTEAVQLLSQCGHGLHGLGDDEFGVSKVIIDHLVDNVPGFVQRSHKQLVMNHGSVCDKISADFEDELSEEDDIEVPRSCEHLLGRYCVADIKDAKLFANCLEMVKSIARAMAKMRSVKIGKLKYLSPTPVFEFDGPKGKFQARQVGGQERVGNNMPEEKETKKTTPDGPRSMICLVRNRAETEHTHYTHTSLLVSLCPSAFKW